MFNPSTYVVKLHNGNLSETVIVSADTAYNAGEIAQRQFPTYKITSILKKKED